MNADENKALVILETATLLDQEGGVVPLDSFRIIVLLCQGCDHRPSMTLDYTTPTEYAVLRAVLGYRSMYITSPAIVDRDPRSILLPTRHTPCVQHARLHCLCHTRACCWIC